MELGIGYIEELKTDEPQMWVCEGAKECKHGERCGHEGRHRKKWACLDNCSLSGARGIPVTASVEDRDWFVMGRTMGERVAYSTGNACKHTKDSAQELMKQLRGVLIPPVAVEYRAFKWSDGAKEED